MIRLRSGCYSILFKALLWYRFHSIICVTSHAALSGLIESSDYPVVEVFIRLALALDTILWGFAWLVFWRALGWLLLGFCWVRWLKDVETGLFLLDGVFLLLLLVIALRDVRVGDLLAQDLMIRGLHTLRVRVIWRLLVTLLLDTLETLRLTVDVIRCYKEWRLGTKVIILDLTICLWEKVNWLWIERGC